MGTVKEDGTYWNHSGTLAKKNYKFVWGFGKKYCRGGGGGGGGGGGRGRGRGGGRGRSIINFYDFIQPLIL